MGTRTGIAALMLFALATGAAAATPLGPGANVGLNDPLLEGSLAPAGETSGDPPLPLLGSTPISRSALDAAPPPTSGSGYRFVTATDDLNRDSTADFFVSEYVPGAETTSVAAVSGKDGTTKLWSHDNGRRVDFQPRPGAPNHDPPTTHVIVPDADHDNLHDVVVYSFEDHGAAFEGTLSLLSGKDGSEQWSVPILGTRQSTGPVNQIVNLPTGWTAYASGNGVRVAYKTTDITYVFKRTPQEGDPPDPSPGQGDVTMVTEHVHLLDATDGGKEKWHRILLPTTDRALYSWITGPAELDGDDEPDLVLDQWMIHNPQSDKIYDPITGDPLFVPGWGMRMKALHGNNGEDLWDVLIYEQPIRFQPPMTEEPFPILQWTHGQVLADVTGDGVPEPMALYKMNDSVMPGTVNGLFRTHFVLLEGKTGDVLFDVARIGWGFATSLSPPGASAPYVVLGTVDGYHKAPEFDMGNGQTASKFPRKEVHLSVVHATKGTPLWDWNQRYFEDSYLAYDVALRQVLHNIAPYDWDEDGVRDLLTPAQYKSFGRAQGTLYTKQHKYTILSGATGEVLRTFDAWGGVGQVLQCDEYGPEVTLANGLSRRMEVSRINGATGDTLWRKTVYFDAEHADPRIGVGLSYFSPSCSRGLQDLFFSLNLETSACSANCGGPSPPGPPGGGGGGGAPQTTSALHSIVGAIDREAHLEWLDPPLPAEIPPLPKPILPPEPLIVLPPGWTLKDTALVLGSIVPGAGVGVAFASLGRARKKDSL